jgi:hypothetical protein
MSEVDASLRKFRMHVHIIELLVRGASAMQSRMEQSVDTFVHENVFNRPLDFQTLSRDIGRLKQYYANSECCGAISHCVYPRLVRLKEIVL